MKKRTIIASILCVAALTVFGCGGGNQTTQKTEEKAPAQNTQAAGDAVAISGSTSTEDVVKVLADEFMAQNPNIKITYEGIGSSAGVKNAIDGVSQIGTASRAIKSEETAKGLTTLTFAHDGIAAVVHPDNKVADLSMEQIAKIYQGEITNWSEVGGDDAKIIVVSREEGSGTRDAFEELAKLESIVSSATIAEGNGNVQTTVAGNPNAIGYVSFSYLNDTIKALTIAGHKPEPAAVLAGDYELARPFNMVYKAEGLGENTKKFLEFVQSDEGKTLITEEGGIVE